MADETVERNQAIERLRAWATRARHEAQEADTRGDMLNWEGQAQALDGVASFLAGPGGQLDDDQVWKRLVADRSRAIADWEHEKAGPEAMFYAGVVAGYDVALTRVTDVAGHSWTRETRSARWVNR